jgi:hypothetical protein
MVGSSCPLIANDGAKKARNGVFFIKFLYLTNRFNLYIPLHAITIDPRECQGVTKRMGDWRLIPLIGGLSHYWSSAAVAGFPECSMARDWCGGLIQ